MNACHSCAVVVANGDTSHIEPGDVDVIAATIESFGLVSIGAPVDGYIRCYLCGWDHMGGYELKEMN